MSLPNDPEELAELRARLALWRTKGIGPSLYGKLLKQFGSAHHVLKEASASWPSALTEALRYPDWRGADADCVWLEHSQHTVLWHPDVRLSTQSLMPAPLSAIPHAPPLLFVKGNSACLQQLQIAMVGSRKPSAYGLAMGYELAQQIAALGIVVVSGLAIGIDGQCQRGALSVGGQSVAVLGVGLDQVYPRQHAALAERLLAQNGALVSEFPLKTPPLPEHFPRRNRLISGLSLAVIVVEATLKSGSLITAHYALEQGRDVFALPGSIRQGYYQGCHALIKEGAYLLEDLADVMAVLPSVAALAQSVVNGRVIKPSFSGLAQKEQQLLAVLEEEPLNCDEIQVRMPLPIEELSVLLTNLMIKGYLIEEADGYRLAF